MSKCLHQRTWNSFMYQRCHERQERRFCRIERCGVAAAAMHLGSGYHCVSLTCQKSMVAALSLCNIQVMIPSTKTEEIINVLVKVPSELVSLPFWWCFVLLGWTKKNFGQINISFFQTYSVLSNRPNIYLTKILKGQQKSIAMRKTLRLPRKWKVKALTGHTWLCYEIAR